MTEKCPVTGKEHRYGSADPIMSKDQKEVSGLACYDCHKRLWESLK